MTPFYFGDVNRALFGIHHQPTVSQFRNSAVVLCNPVGFEYSRVHSLYRHLAKKLAFNGYHVLRFDYYATGDSSGYSHEVSIEQCLKDIALSCDEIKTISATKKITIIGCRMGASLAVSAAKNYKLNHLVLWDPVINGEQYLRELQAMQKKMRVDPDRFDMNYLSDAADENELIGHPFTPELRNEIKRINLKNIEQTKARKIDILCYEDNVCSDELVCDGKFAEKASVYCFDAYADWAVIDKIESRVLPDPSIEKIIELVS